MLLRRVIEHVKAQNWTAVALDFLIVVVGVFIGIQVANWNDAQQDRRLERGILERFHTELVVREERNNRVAADEERTRRDLYEARKVLLGLVAIRPFSAQECQAISRSDAPQLPEVGVAIIDELVATGRLDLITDAEIRRGASALHQLKSERETNFETYLRNGFSLIRGYPRLLPFSLSPADDPDDEDGYSPAFECDQDKMMSDQAFLNDFAHNVSIYATAGNFIRSSTAIIHDLHEALDQELGVKHEDAQ